MPILSYLQWYALKRVYLVFSAESTQKNTNGSLFLMALVQLVFQIMLKIRLVILSMLNYPKLILNLKLKVSDSESKPIIIRISRLEEIGVIESVKSVSNIVAPVSGAVIEVNENLEETPDLVNKDPLGEGEERP